MHISYRSVVRSGSKTYAPIVDRSVRSRSKAFASIVDTWSSSSERYNGSLALAPCLCLNEHAVSTKGTMGFVNMTLINEDSTLTLLLHTSSDEPPYASEKSRPKKLTRRFSD